MADKEPGKRLAGFAALPGDPLEDIEGQEVTITKIELSKRRLRDDPEAPFALITLDDGKQYHTWSAFLIDKLEQIPGDALPGPAKFVQVLTAAKRKVWSIE